MKLSCGRLMTRVVQFCGDHVGSYEWLALALMSTLCIGHCTAQTLVPNLPWQLDDYYGYAVTNLPTHYQEANIVAADNTPVDNQITNAGATLGRVLFYDKRLSHNYTVGCASCHTQETGFSDTRQKSQGVNGQTGRHSMALGNAKYYGREKFFWDERADTLEDQVLMPIQDPVEMGMDLATLTTRLSQTAFYPDLFNAAFGTPDVTSDRILESTRTVCAFNGLLPVQIRFDFRQQRNARFGPA